MVLALGLVSPPLAARAEPERDLRQELQQLKAQMEHYRRRMEQLESQLESVEAENVKRSKELEEKIANRLLNRSNFGRYMDRFAGEHRFHLTGYGTANFEWQDLEDTNTFSSDIFPIFLYRLTDRALFEGELELDLEETATEVSLEYAQIDYILNDYATLVAGKFLLPFGEFMERLHPAWINKLVSRPLPYVGAGAGGLFKFSQVGVQLRGGIPLGYGDGAMAEYSLYVTNGPSFASDKRGAPVSNNFADQNRGKGYGARIGLELLPFDYGWGRFRIGASTLDGKWDEGGDLWFTSWGIDSVYQNGPLELRGEYLRFNREMPGALTDDEREGWYLQAAYQLTKAPIPYLDRTELVVRWSGRNQNAPIEAGEEEEGGDLFRKPRQVAVGLNYWLTPSVVWKLEYDREMPAGAGDSNAFQTQFAIGF